MSEPGKRIAVLDALRGAALVQMVVYHGLYDWVYVFGQSAAWFTASRNAYLWQQAICWTFILVSGASFHYSRRGLRRGALVFGCGMLLTAVTLAVLPSERILFGVLHFLGLAMMLSAAVRGLLLRVPACAGFLASAALFCLTKQLPYGFLGFLDVRLWALPQTLYQSAWTFPLGLMGPGFYSADYFPLFPWLFLFWAGLYGWRLLMATRAGAALRALRPVPVLNALGRRSLLCYMLHQPLLLAAVWLLAAAVRAG